MSALLVGVVVWIVVREDPGDIVGQLPVGADDNVPTVSLLVAGGAIAATIFCLLAALQTAAVMRVLARDRRIPSPAVAKHAPAARRDPDPLGPEAVRVAREADPPPGRLPDTAYAKAGPLRLTVLIPAHDEQLTIEATLRSLRGQTRPPDRIMVVADNRTDNTAALAAAAGAEVIETVGNTHKKAGALNQALNGLFVDLDERDVTMVMDADGVIAPTFLEVAMDLLEVDPDLIAVGGIFTGEAGGGLVGQLQRNEYVRYQRQINRRAGHVFVLTGTASLFRTFALRAVADARGPLIPGEHGHVYDTLALTEDNEMTLALKSLGAKMVSPAECVVTTEIMPTWSALWRQRMRWQRGTLENIGAYGLTRATLAYWGQQVGIGYGTIALNSYFLLMTITFLAADSFALVPFWTVIGCIFIVERVVTVWRVGWPGRLIALPLVIELAYDLMLQAVYVKSLIDIASGRKAGWNYVPREAPQAVPQ